jgi:predicted ribonuclease toxin of YeeF-YezG toxin-antitoxin module
MHGSEPQILHSQTQYNCSKTQEARIEESLKNAKELYGSFLACWLALYCLFQKRKKEICKLKRKELTIEDNYLIVHFSLGTEKIALKEYPVNYVLEYLREYDIWARTSKRQTEYLFPSKRKAASIIIHSKNKTYTYRIDGGYLSRADFYNRVKKVYAQWHSLGKLKTQDIKLSETWSELRI